MTASLLPFAPVTENLYPLVLPNQSQGEKTHLYQVWVRLTKKLGWVLTGNCTSMADLESAYNNLAALLFKLEATVHYNLTENTASIIQLCSWNAAKTQVTPAPASAIEFSRPRKRSLSNLQGDSRNYTNFSCEDPTVGEEAISFENFTELQNIFLQLLLLQACPLLDFQVQSTQFADAKIQLQITRMKVRQI